MAWFDSERRVKEFVVNFVLLVIVLISWGYVIAAGKFLSEKHLNRIDLTQFQDERPVGRFWKRDEE